MPKFFQSEIAAFDGEKSKFKNVEFKKHGFENSSAAESGAILEFIPVHYPNPPVIQFMAYIDNLTENYDVSVTSEQPFGRTNPYHIWKGNDRTITLGFNIPSSGLSTGMDNMNNLSWLLASLYPSYKDTTTSNSVAASPLFRVRYANLICSSTSSGQGLLCVVGNVGVTHDVEQGFLSANPKNVGTAFANTAGKLISQAGFTNSVPEGKKFLIPKLIKLNMDLKVVHDHGLGWDVNTGEFRGGRSAPSFPHDFGLVRDAKDSPDPGGNTFTSAGASSAAASGTPDAQRQAVDQQRVMGADDASGTPGHTGVGERSE